MEHVTGAFRKETAEKGQSMRILQTLKNTKLGVESNSDIMHIMHAL